MKKLLIYANTLQNKTTGENFLSYRTKNEELDKYVNVIFCREAKEVKPLQTCYAVVEDKNCNFTKDRNGYDVCFISKVENFLSRE